MLHHRFERCLRKEDEKRLDECDDGVATRANSTAVAAWLSAMKATQRLRRFFPGAISTSVMRLSQCVRLAVLDATLMNRSVSAAEMSPPV